MPLKLCLFGAAPDTGNLGVSALCFSALRMIFRADGEAEVTVFDEGSGCRRGIFDCDGKQFEYRLCGEKLSRRYWQSESLWNIRVSSWLGGLMNKSSRAILNADAVLDVSGGDSFTDLYGPKRFRAVTLLKQLVIEQRIPLILLPQTYGPFENQGCREIAREIVTNAAVAWARDENSFEVLQKLLGEAFDERRHQCGVDMAFELEAREPDAAARDQVCTWIESAAGAPIVGINVSGLLFNAADGGKQQYQLKADYKRVVVELVKRLLGESDCRILLVPHVVTPRGHFESDVDAGEATALQVDGEKTGRVMVLPALEDPREVKWVISQMDWFCGTRMHSTIAGLSSGVPTAAIAYSMKTSGVFETCGQGECVIDPRKLGTEEAVEKLWGCWGRREISKGTLSKRLPEVQRRAGEQMGLIVRAATVGAETPKEEWSKQS